MKVEMIHLGVLIPKDQHTEGTIIDLAKAKALAEKLLEVCVGVGHDCVDFDREYDPEGMSAACVATIAISKSHVVILTLDTETREKYQSDIDALLTLWIGENIRGKAFKDKDGNELPVIGNTRHARNKGYTGLMPPTCHTMRIRLFNTRTLKGGPWMDLKNNSYTEAKTAADTGDRTKESIPKMTILGIDPTVLLPVTKEKESPIDISRI